MKKNVLIIDDEVDFCLLLKTYLERKNYRVFTAHNLQDGLHCLKEVDIDILFLDNNLPDGFGWKYANHILATNDKIQLNLLSAHKSNIADYNLPHDLTIIEKPVNLSKIEEQILR